MATEAISCSSLWSDDLPPELAGLVLRRLPSLADRFRFGAVCRRWSLAAQRQAPTLPPALPWISSCRSGVRVFNSFPDGELHNLGSGQRIPSLVCYGSSENWLMLMSSVQQVNNFLKNPLSGATIPLPDNVLSGLRFIQKFIVCSDGLIVAMTRRHIAPPSPSNVPLIACCRPGMSSWSTTATPGYEDMAFHHGNIYGVTRQGGLYAHNISEDSGTGEPVISHAKQVIEGGHTWLYVKQFFLVVSRGNLLFVKRNPTESRYGRNSEAPAFEILKADFEMSRWSKVSSLGDQVLFVSGRCSKAISASSHGNYLCGDCIYFIYHETYPSPNIHHHPGTTICGMYDLRDKISHRTLTLECSSLVPAWFFPHK